MSSVNFFIDNDMANMALVQKSWSLLAHFDCMEPIQQPHQYWFIAKLKPNKLIDKILIKILTYSQTSNISCTFVGNKIIDHSDVAPVGAVPTTFSFLT